MFGPIEIYRKTFVRQEESISLNFLKFHIILFQIISCILGIIYLHSRIWIYALTCVCECVDVRVSLMVVHTNKSDDRILHFKMFCIKNASEKRFMVIRLLVRVCICLCPPIVLCLQWYFEDAPWIERAHWQLSC